MKHRFLKKIIVLTAVSVSMVSGCSSTADAVEEVANIIVEGEGQYSQQITEAVTDIITGGGSGGGGGGGAASSDPNAGYTTVAPERVVTETGFSYNSIPAYSGQPAVEVNDNEPYFTSDDWNSAMIKPEQYGELDSLERCTGCMALVSLNTMPAEERGEIGQIKPSGWHTVKYDFIEGNYLYNRCHLIAYQMTGENANPLNLVTGTRYMNVAGQLPYEDEITSYVRQTGDPVLYRVTPIFVGDDLVCRGVLTEASNLSGTFGCCVFCYNVQPGVAIDYATGNSWESGDFTGSDYDDPFYD